MNFFMKNLTKRETLPQYITRKRKKTEQTKNNTMPPAAAKKKQNRNLKNKRLERNQLVYTICAVCFMYYCQIDLYVHAPFVIKIEISDLLYMYVHCDIVTACLQKCLFF
jgi:hypothetical protein